jgi:hypothetical protein
MKEKKRCRKGNKRSHSHDYTVMPNRIDIFTNKSLVAMESDKLSLRSIPRQCSAAFLGSVLKSKNARLQRPPFVFGVI